MLDTASRAETIAAAGRPSGKLGVLLQRLGLRRQVLVILHDVAIALASLPIAFMLRDSNLTLTTFRIDHVSAMLPLLAATARSGATWPNWPERAYLDILGRVA